MKYLPITTAVLLLGLVATARSQVGSTHPPASLMSSAEAQTKMPSTLARVTVYWASGGGGSDSNTRHHRCASGAYLRAGHCAVDPRRIPYGSRVHFADGICIAADTGRDVVNRKAARRAGRTQTERQALVIDRFFETKAQAIAWANSHPAFLSVQIEPAPPARPTLARELAAAASAASNYSLGR